MPVFEITHQDEEFEGQALLMSILHPSRAEQARAKINGRRRVARLATLTDPMVPEPHFPVRADEIAQVTVPTV